MTSRPDVTTPLTAPHSQALLAATSLVGGWDVQSAAPCDRSRGGSVSAAARPRIVRRAEPGSVGPLVLEAQTVGPRIRLAVWGDSSTPPEEAKAALIAVGDWVGARDDPDAGARAAARHPVTARLWAALGPLRIGALPRVGEAAGRAVIGQLVQGLEAAISTAQVARALGQPAPGRLWAWPTAARLGAAPAFRLRRCGLSGRGVRALHALAVHDERLRRRSHDRAALGLLLGHLPGIGVWTIGETLLGLGDPDAVPVGDYHLPSVVGSALTGEQRPRAAWTDQEMLTLLEPFHGQRARMALLCRRGASRGLAAGPPRRAPRAALSRHRYW